MTSTSGFQRSLSEKFDTVVPSRDVPLRSQERPPGLTDSFEPGCIRNRCAVVHPFDSGSSLAQGFVEIVERGLPSESLTRDVGFLVRHDLPLVARAFERYFIRTLSTHTVILDFKS